MDLHLPFIRTILANPDDSSAWLKYADWLETFSDRRGEYVRLVVALAHEVLTQERRIEIQNQIRELRRTIEPHWVALVDRPIIELCRFTFGYRCPNQWEKLELTDDEFVRHCNQCEKHVYYCRSMKQARRHASQGRCVAIDPYLPRKLADLSGSLPSQPPTRDSGVRLGTGRIGHPRKEIVEEDELHLKDFKEYMQ